MLNNTVSKRRGTESFTKPLNSELETIKGVSLPSVDHWIGPARPPVFFLAGSLVVLPLLKEQRYTDVSEEL